MLTNSLNLPQPFVDAATSDHRYKPRRYSVTEVLGGTCEAVLKRRHQGEGDEDVADMVWAIFGTAVHEVLRRSEATDSQLQEQWFSVDIPVDTETYTLSGIFDLYDEETKTVTDWKTTSCWTVIFGDFDKWRKQTLVYCWMLRQCGLEADRGEIVALLRDHSMRKARTEKGYPRHPVFRVSWQFTEEDFADIGREIALWFLEAHAQEALPDDELEPCSPDTRWHKSDKWAVKKKGRKTAIRVYDNKGDAYQRAAMENNHKDGPYYVEFRQGEDTKCESYCSVAQWCPYGRKIFEESQNSRSQSA